MIRFRETLSAVESVVVVDGGGGGGGGRKGSGRGDGCCGGRLRGGHFKYGQLVSLVTAVVRVVQMVVMVVEVIVHGPRGRLHRCGMVLFYLKLMERRIGRYHGGGGGRRGRGRGRLLGGHGGRDLLARLQRSRLGPRGCRSRRQRLHSHPAAKTTSKTGTAKTRDTTGGERNVRGTRCSAAREFAAKRKRVSAVGAFARRGGKRPLGNVWPTARVVRKHVFPENSS